MPVLTLLLSLIGAAPCMGQPPVPPPTVPPVVSSFARRAAGNWPLCRRPCRSRRLVRHHRAAERRRWSLPLDAGLNLKPAPIEPTDHRFPVNLATALRLSDARPLMVAAAQAGVWVAEAELTGPSSSGFRP